MNTYMGESFRIIPEFRILRLIFHSKLASKYGIRQIILAFLMPLHFNLQLVHVCTEGKL